MHGQIMNNLPSLFVKAAHTILVCVCARGASRWKRYAPVAHARVAHAACGGLARSPAAVYRGAVCSGAACSRLSARRPARGDRGQNRRARRRARRARRGAGGVGILRTADEAPREAPAEGTRPREGRAQPLRFPRASAIRSCSLGQGRWTRSLSAVMAAGAIVRPRRSGPRGSNARSLRVPMVLLARNRI